MPQHWAIRFSIEGDLRFLSHHETMRLMERIAGRAKLPLRYSQGFNPHPLLSLACPRPVGIAGCDELLVASLEDEFAGGDQGLLSAVNAFAPAGMKFERGELMASSKPPQIERTEYTLELDATQATAVRARLAELEHQQQWPLERQTPAKRGRDERKVTLDLRAMVEPELTGPSLKIAIRTAVGSTARPGEALQLLGLDPRIDLAAMRRTRVVCANG